MVPACCSGEDDLRWCAERSQERSARWPRRYRRRSSDIDGSPAEATVRFALDSIICEIDLTLSTPRRSAPPSPL